MSCEEIEASARGRRAASEHCPDMKCLVTWFADVLCSFLVYLLWNAEYLCRTDRVHVACIHLAEYASCTNSIRHSLRDMQGRLTRGQSVVDWCVRDCSAAAVDERYVL